MRAASSSPTPGTSPRWRPRTRSGRCCSTSWGSPVGMADVLITEYTDPGCPWAYSAEPFRRRLAWLYGDRLQWETCMVVLAEDPAEYLERDFTPERQSAAFA